MPESSIVVRPEPMESESYTASSRLQAAGLREAIALFEQAAAEVPLPAPPQPIVLADYGAATGHNSLLPICSAVRTIRGRTRLDHSVLVAHTDVPDNDFSELFRTLTADPDSYLHEDSNTFPTAVGRSFYEQILPTSSVHLGWSSWAVQWLRRVPAPIPDHLHIEYSASDDVRAAYTKQAANDWLAFIACRGRELRRGGRLMVMTMGVDDTGEFGYRPLLKALMDTLNELAGQQLLSPEEVHRMCIPIVGRSKSDFLAPFAPKGRFEQLEIEHLEVFDAEDRFYSQFQIHKDAAVFGQQWAAFLRASVFRTLASALEGGLADPRSADFFDRLETGVAQRVAAAPEQVQIPMAHLVLVKRPKVH
ncbi:SAM-dependent methyltransferase [Mycolicibacterium pulveris]|uniref:SAM-dependent methyltransferase n=1 Tax=Mycolicibacterium pulveris TaxID=36813 RepID=UPI003CEEE413